MLKAMLNAEWWRRSVLCIALFVIPFSIQHLAFSIDTAAQDSAPPPLLTAPVNDFANVVDDRVERELDRRIRALLQASGDVVVVATVKTFQPYADIDSFAVKMFENQGRGVGQKGKDNGLLIVLAVDDRRVRIETGYDLEEFITDGYAGETIRTAMRPHFTRGDYGEGLLAGATQIINRIADRRGVRLDNVPRAQPPATGPQTQFPFGLIIFLIFIVFSFLSRLGGGRRRRRGPRILGPWSGWNSGVGPFGGGGFGGGFGGFGGGGGGGFGGFGGGRSGGGGASGGW